MVPPVVVPLDTDLDKEINIMVVRLGATRLIYCKIYEPGANVVSTNKTISFYVFY
jgi:hypothetical protein